MFARLQCNLRAKTQNGNKYHRKSLLHSALQPKNLITLVTT